MAGLGSVAAAVLSVKVLVDASQAAAGMGEAATGVQKFQAKIGKLVAPAALVGAALIGMGKTALNAASDSEQAMGGVETVFGKSADTVKAWGNQAAKSAGLSATQYAVAAAKIGSQLKTAGIPMDQIADRTRTMIQTGADLAATYGGTTADAVDALSAAMRGEADPAERYGLALNATAISAQMAADGTSKLTGTAYTAAKAQATMTLVAKQGADSLGQFAAQSGTAAEKTQIADAAWANAAATLGAVLLPASVAVSNVLAGIAGWMQRNSTVTQVLVGVIGALAAVVLGVAAALKVYTAIQTVMELKTKAVAAAQWLWNAALTANPVGLVIVAVAALIAVIVLLWNKSDAFRSFFTAVWSSITAAAAAAWRAIQAAGAAALAAVSAAVRTVGSVAATVWNSISSAARAAWSAVSAVVHAAADGILAIVRAIAAPIAAVWNAVQASATAAWNAVVRTVQTVVNGVKAAWETVVAAVAAVFQRAASAVASALSPIRGMIDAIKSVWDSTVGAISNGIAKVGSWLGGLLGKAKSVGSSIAGAVTPKTAVAAVHPGGYAVPASSAAVGLSARAMTAAPVSVSSGAQIVVQGALDPDAVARQIRSILTGRDRRISGVRIGGLA